MLPGVLKSCRGASEMPPESSRGSRGASREVANRPSPFVELRKRIAVARATSRDAAPAFGAGRTTPLKIEELLDSTDFASLAAL